MTNTTLPPGSADPNESARWLSIVGIGEDGWNGLSTDARRLINSAELLYGGARHLALVPIDEAPMSSIPWSSPMAAAIERILTEHRGRRRVTVLASGDPMLYGVGVTLTRDLPASEFRVVPQVSSFSLACSRLGWPVAETTLITLVHRPPEQIIRHLNSGQRLIIFSENSSTPAIVAQRLIEAGYGSSEFNVFENLGGPSERVTSELAANWSMKDCAKLNLIALFCIADDAVEPLSLCPGLPDDAFQTDGQMTKREVRAATLARLSPLPGQMLWDVGAGTGTIGIEWMRVHPSCSCIAFEAREDRAARIRANAGRLGVPTLRVLLGTAPATFEGLQPPNKVFIGGGLCHDELFDAAWDALLHGGRMVANAVTIQSEAMLATLHARYGGDLTRIAISRAELIGGVSVWRPMMPITQWTAIKP